MRIFGDNRLTNLDAYLKGVRDKKRPGEATGKDSDGAGSTDKVVLSREAKQIQKAKELIEGLPDIRKEKVEAIKSRIEDGTYEIDREKIASKMIIESLLNDVS